MRLPDPDRLSRLALVLMAVAALVKVMLLVLG